MTLPRPALVVCVVWAILVAARSGALAAPPVAARPLAVRVQWGGGQPQAWSGRIALVAGTSAPPESLRWRSLCLESDAAAMVHDDGATIHVHQPRPVALDGVEIDVADPRGLRLLVELGPARGGNAAATIDVPLCDLLSESVQRPLDAEGNRLTARLAPGEPLRVAVEMVGAVADGRHTVPRPGDAVRFTVDPLLPVRPDGTAVVELRMRLTAPSRPGDIAVQSTTLVPADGGAVDGLAAERWARFKPVVFDVTLPGDEGVYDVILDAVERGSLRWARPVGSRTVQVPAVAGVPAAAGEAGDWRVIYELDPGSPKLHERLRRLPGVGLGDVPLPAMPLPSFTRPSMALPRLPSVPSLSAVPSLPTSLPSMSSISSMVPRFSGLLSTGHSRVEAHALGPVLRLPPASSAGAPTWEGIVVAGVEPGVPHAVEIEFPTGQDATVGVTVLEADAAGAQVFQRHAGGFEVRRSEWSAEPARLATHRFVFWPTTRHPLLVIANPAPDATALFGRVRVLAGPERLPAAAVPVGGRGLHAFLPSPDLTGFGGPDRMHRGSGPTVVDWGTHLTAVRHFSDLLHGHAAAGALVTVFARGAALWPSGHTREAARWDAGRVSDAGLDVTAKDVLELLCRVFGREGQRLVPAVSFDAPLPELESILARGGGEAVGLVCLGRDGRPARLEGGGMHYNVLDPRVQRVVETIVGELAGRLASHHAVDGIALVLPHDGWLHLPGTAWPLDDVTFARFMETVARDAAPDGLPPAVAAVAAADPGDGGRFAARAAVVLGPLRDAWLAWRAAEIAEFHARLAALVAEGGGAAAGAGEPRSLWIVPTTLLAAGEAAAGFRPVLGGDDGRTPLLELGLDPERSTRDPHVVFVAPQVRGAVGFSARGADAAANRAAAVAAAAARRRGAVIVERSRPLPLASVMPHGPFGNATAPGSWSMHAVAADETSDGALADALAIADAERVFDMGMAYALPAALPAARLEFAALPPRVLEPLAAVAAPLVVRTAREGPDTWVQLVNPVAAAARVELLLESPPAADAAADRGGAVLPPQPAARVAYDVGPRGLRAVRLDGGPTVAEAVVTYDAAAQEAAATRVTRLRRLRAALEAPVPIAVLDNPGFELGGGAGASPAPVVPGWELVEPRRGSVTAVPGIAAAGGKALAFSSVHGLSTLRSNPFTRPASGRVSVAAWLRIRDGDPQPPLRLALEGVRDDREYYRFAAIGGLTGGRPLAREWSQFVLQVDDLPDTGLDALRVRFDLLGPGTVEIDEVRVFDLAFDERQRVQLSRIVSLLEQGLAEGDVGGCLAGLAGYWPRYLEAFVPDTAGAPAAAAAPNAPRSRTGVMDRVRRLWQ